MKNAIGWLLIIVSLACLVASFMVSGSDQLAWILTLVAVAAFLTALALQR